MKGRKFYVYEIINTINGKSYVGSTNDMRRRSEAHLYGSGCKPLRRDISYHGRDAFITNIIKEFDNENDARNYESNLLQTYFEGYYNTSTQVQNHHFTGKNHTLESKKKSQEMRHASFLREYQQCLTERSERHLII